LHERFKHELKVLNDEQKKAVLKSILAKNYHMVLGIPGSGKTTAIVVLIRILAAMKQRILVVSFTNSAIDNVLGRLKMTGFNNFVRVTNNISSADEYVQSNVRTYQMFDSMDQIRQTLDENYVFGTTCL
jgi:DNA replication ATP-dependent helicase Dna2